MANTKEKILEDFVNELSTKELEKFAYKHFKKVCSELQKISKRLEEKRTQGARRTTGPYKLPL